MFTIEIVNGQLEPFLEKWHLHPTSRNVLMSPMFFYTTSESLLEHVLKVSNVCILSFEVLLDLCQK